MSSKSLDEMSRNLRRRHYSIRTEQSYCAWVKRYVRFHKMRTRQDLKDGKKDIRTIQALLGHKDISTTMIYTHVLQQDGHGVSSPLDDL